jgi:hypothetical protein
MIQSLNLLREKIVILPMRQESLQLLELQQVLVLVETSKTLKTRHFTILSTLVKVSSLRLRMIKIYKEVHQAQQEVFKKAKTRKMVEADLDQSMLQARIQQLLAIKVQISQLTCLSSQ